MNKVLICNTVTTFTKLQVSVTRTEKYFCVSVLGLVQVATGDILNLTKKFLQNILCWKFVTLVLLLFNIASVE